MGAGTAVLRLKLVFSLRTSESKTLGSECKTIDPALRTGGGHHEGGTRKLENCSPTELERIRSAMRSDLAGAGHIKHAREEARSEREAPSRLCDKGESYNIRFIIRRCGADSCHLDELHSDKDRQNSVLAGDGGAGQSSLRCAQFDPRFAVFF